jgi:hypothetical protein
MERLPMPAPWSRVLLHLKVGAAFSEQDLRTRLEALGYDLDEEADYPSPIIARSLVRLKLPQTAGIVNPIVASADRSLAVPPKLSV